MLKPTSALVNERLSDRFKSSRLARSLIRFRDDESGSMIVFVLFIFVLMLVFGGIAVDYMRFEIRRVALQQTLDRAALAAASLTQAEDPQAVADDYFAKAGLSGLVMAEYGDPDVDVTEGSANESRKVRVTADVRSYNYFMGSFFLPYDYLEAPAASTAEQGVKQIEVMLVLDITGSMNETLPNDTRKKIEGLRDAASLFVNLLKDKDSLNQVSIGIVPYNTQVNLGRTLREQFIATNLPRVGGVANSNVPNSNCLETPTTTAAFSSTSIPTGTAYPISVFADLESATNTNSNTYVAPNNTSNATLRNPTIVPDSNGNNGGGGNYMCPPYAYSEVLLPTKERGPLLTKINSLQPNGRTSIMMGMRWGMALLDESARPIYDNLITEEGMEGRPADNNDPQTRKILVLMTDGNHVETRYIRDPYKSGPSPIYRSNNDGNYSILLRPGNANPFWVPHICDNSSSSRRDGCTAGWRPVAWSNSANNGTFRQLDWSEVWQAVRVTWVAQQLYGRSMYTGQSVGTIYNAQLAAFRGGTTSRGAIIDPYVAKGTMDSLLRRNCDAAKAANVEVFGIAFGAGADGEAQIEGCASSESATDPDDKTGYFYKPQTTADLVEAFKDIVEKASPLALTE